MRERVNATPLGPGAPEVTVVLRVEDDPSVFPVESAGVQVHYDLLGRPVVDLRDTGVSESAVGRTLLDLLRDALEGGEQP